MSGMRHIYVICCHKTFLGHPVVWVALYVWYGMEKQEIPSLLTIAKLLSSQARQLSLPLPHLNCGFGQDPQVLSSCAAILPMILPSSL